MEEITREICKRNNIVPTRSRGQNFLINEAVYDKIVEEAELTKGTKVIEVGPGLGFLTEKLSFQAKQVTAIELDDKLACLLEKRMASHDIKNVKVINEDVLDVLSGKISNFKHQIQNSSGGNDSAQDEKKDTAVNKQTNHQSLIPNHYKLVANLPYNITSVFLRKVYELNNKPESMVLLLQKEVAERIAARPGKMSKLSVMCQFYARPEIIMNVASHDFWPAPKVESAVIKLTTLDKPKLDSQEEVKEFFRLIRIAFAQKRKMLKKNLANGYHVDVKDTEKWLEKAGFALNTRAQELSVENWIHLLSFINI